MPRRVIFLDHELIIALMYMKYSVAMTDMNAGPYTNAMSEPKTQRHKSIADFRNEMAEAIDRAKWRDEVTVLTSRRKPVVAVVSLAFYERALAALGEERVTVEDDKPAKD